MTTKVKRKISLHWIIPVLLVSVLVFSAFSWYRASKTYEPTFELTLPEPEFYESMPPIEQRQAPSPVAPEMSTSPPAPTPLAKRIDKPAQLSDADWSSIEMTALRRYSEESEADRVGLYKSSQEEAQIRQIYHLVRAATEWRLANGN